MNVILDARTATPHFPGIGRYVTNLILKMQAFLDMELDILILIDSRVQHDWQQRFLPYRNKIISSHCSSFSISQQWQIPVLLRQVKTDLYHSPYYLMPYNLPAPCILTVYDAIPTLFPHYSTLQAKILFHLMTRLAVRASTHIIAISETTKNDYIKIFKIPNNKISTVPLAISPQFQPQSCEEINRIREKYSLPEFFILYLGTNKPHKNLNRLVDSWAVNRRTLSPIYSLIIAGYWNDRYPQSKDMVLRLGLSDSVKFLGQIPDEDMPGLYSAASLFIYPSLYEGFGLPVLEAMSCGTPVLCSNISSLVEICGDAAVYFNPININDIADKIQSVIGNKASWEQIRERGLERASRFSWNITAMMTVKIYQEILNRAMQYS